MSLLLSRESKGKREILEIVGFIILYAISDEYHQSFIPGRDASFKDVGIDTLGGISGIVIVKLLENFTIISLMFYTKKIVVVSFFCFVLFSFLNNFFCMLLLFQLWEMRLCRIHLLCLTKSIYFITNSFSIKFHPQIY